MLAFDPVVHASGDTGGLHPYGDTSLEEVGALLDATVGLTSDDRGGRSGPHPPILAVVLGYEGRWQAFGYDRGVILTGEGWRVFGPLDPADAPAPRSPAAEAVEPRVPDPSEPLVDEPTSDMDRESFVEAVERVRRAVAAGDVYVLNLTYRICGRPLHGPSDTFAALTSRGAGSMSAALIGPENSVLSISPERFLALDGDMLSIEPIKGTRPRGATPGQDEAYAAELAASDKERAEHVMVVDLERNDLGRVAALDSVHVSPLFEVVPTPYCHQLVSVVRARLAPGVGCAAILEATFPCGSVTGAPKVSAMRHIAELEPSPRGPYCGTLIVAAPGRLDSSVLIRTAVHDGESLTYGTGGGITFDSDPQAEWEETLVKAAPLLGLSHP